jgi:hypothetical protein
MNLTETYLDELTKKEKINQIIRVTMTIKEINEGNIGCIIIWNSMSSGNFRIKGEMAIRLHVNEIAPTKNILKETIHRVMDLILDKVSIIIKEDPRKYEEYMKSIGTQLLTFRLIYKDAYNFDITKHLETPRMLFPEFNFFEMSNGVPFWETHDEFNVDEKEIRFNENLAEWVEVKKTKVANLLKLYGRGKTPEGTPYNIKKHRLELIQKKPSVGDEFAITNKYMGHYFLTIVEIYISDKDLPSYKPHTGNQTVDIDTDNRTGMEKREISDFLKKKLDLFGLNIYQIRIIEI